MPLNLELDTIQQATELGPVLYQLSKGLGRALKHPLEEVRIKAAKAIQELGPTAASTAVEDLLAALNDKSPAVRAEVALTLAQAGRLEPTLVIPALKNSLKDENKEVRIQAARAFTGLGPVAKDAVPALAEALKEEDADDVIARSVCRCSAYALRQIGPDAKGAVPALLRLLKARDERLRTDALAALASIGAPDERVIPALREGLKDKEIRAYAASLLSRAGPRYAQEALPVLVEALDVRTIKNQPAGGRADGILLEVVAALGEMGPAAEPAVPGLQKILEDPERVVVHGAIKRALKKIRP
jgi:HEAT repeat protein